MNATALQVNVNGESQQLAAGCTVQQLLNQLAPGKGRVAVEINGLIVPRSTFNDHVLRNGDTIEIVQAIGGG